MQEKVISQRFATVINVICKRHNNRCFDDRIKEIAGHVTIFSIISGSSPAAFRMCLATTLEFFSEPYLSSIVKSVFRGAFSSTNFLFYMSGTFH